jgi:hypothetical protein
VPRFPHRNALKWWDTLPVIAMGHPQPVSDGDRRPVRDKWASNLPECQEGGNREFRVGEIVAILADLRDFNNFLDLTTRQIFINRSGTQSQAVKHSG